jgi:hypothetical protein
MRRGERRYSAAGAAEAATRMGGAAGEEQMSTAPGQVGNRHTSVPRLDAMAVAGIAPQISAPRTDRMQIARTNSNSTCATPPITGAVRRLWRAGAEMPVGQHAECADLSVIKCQLTSLHTSASSS